MSRQAVAKLNHCVRLGTDRDEGGVMTVRSRCRGRPVSQIPLK